MAGARPPFHKRIGFRVAVGVTLSFFIGSIVLTPIWEAIAGYYHPTGPMPTGLDGWTFEEVVVTVLAILAIGAFFGTILGWITSRLAVQRLAEISAEASEPIAPGSPLPGPFTVDGSDEIADLARALNRMRQRASDVMGALATRDSARNEWVALVSHDLRTPLAALTTSLDLIERRVLNGQTAEILFLVRAAQADTERVTHLATDLLEIARLEVNPELNLEPVDPLELAQHAHHTLGPLAIERSVTLSLENHLPPDFEPIEADGRLLLRALENLISNSLQHALSRVTLHIDQVLSLDGEPRVRFTVEDNGPGLPECEGRVLFSDLKNHRSRADSSGLGLIVTARVAELHGGIADAQNPPQGGASVWFEVSATPAD